MTQRLVIALLAGLAVLPGGCGQPPNNVYDPGPCLVTGVVTLDGKPIAKDGEVLFSFRDGAPPGYGTIRDGEFSLKTRAGQQWVQIFAFRPSRKVPGQLPLPPENYIPARYNAKTQLTVEVGADQPNRFEFHLKTSE